MTGRDAKTGVDGQTGRCSLSLRWSPLGDRREADGALACAAVSFVSWIGPEPVSQTCDPGERLDTSMPNRHAAHHSRRFRAGIDEAVTNVGFLRQEGNEVPQHERHGNRGPLEEADIDREVDEHQRGSRARKCESLDAPCVFTSRGGVCMVTAVSAGVSPFAGASAAGNPTSPRRHRFTAAGDSAGRVVYVVQPLCRTSWRGVRSVASHGGEGRAGVAAGVIGDGRQRPFLPHRCNLSSRSSDLRSTSEGRSGSPRLRTRHASQE